MQPCSHEPLRKMWDGPQGWRKRPLGLWTNPGRRSHGSVEDAWFTLSYSPLRDEAQAVSGALVTVFDPLKISLAHLYPAQSVASQSQLVGMCGDIMAFAQLLLELDQAERMCQSLVLDDRCMAHAPVLLEDTIGKRNTLPSHLQWPIRESRRARRTGRRASQRRDFVPGRSAGDRTTA
jgi:hypothetical protein